MKKSPTKAETWRSVFWAILIAMTIRTVVFEPYSIPSGSMKPNFLVGDYLFVSKYHYGISNASLPFDPPIMNGRLLELNKPERGEVIVFKSSKNRGINYIKRLIGMPGDEIQVIEGLLYINGKMVERSEAGTFTDTDGSILKRYIETLPNGVSYYVLDEISNHTLDNTQVFKVPEGHYFFMGDNRDNSLDSRTNGHPIGFVPYDKFIGRAEMIIFSNPESIIYPWRWVLDFNKDRFFVWVKSL
jgi:signal peptidase I